MNQLVAIDEWGRKTYRRPDGSLFVGGETNYMDYEQSPTTAMPDAVQGEPNALDYYLGPTGIPDRLRQLNALLNPVETIGGSMRASQRMFAPDTGGWDRVAATGDMLSGVAGFAAPMIGASVAGGPAANAVVDAFTGINPGFVADEAGGMKLYRGENGSGERITGGIGEGYLFGTPHEDVARLYGDKVSQFELADNARILTEGTPEFAKITGRKSGPLLRTLRPGENLKDAANEAIARARDAGFDAVEFNSMRDMGTAVMNRNAVKPPPSIRAFHGSPHSFDKFSLDKIGTGEGAQAYGHGLYFAENEGVARSYRDTLSKSGTDGAQRRLQKAGGDIDAAIAEATDRAEKYRAGGADQYASAVEEDLRFLEKYKQTGEWTPGSMYEVNINADPETFLDWDKPLSEQPQAVRDALAARYPDGYDQMKSRPGGDFYQYYMGASTSPADSAGASVQIADEMGIPGIKYLDAGSRNAGDGSRNYVVFDEALIEIVRKYGLAGLALLPGLSNNHENALGGT